MAFKITKASKFKINIQPKDNFGQTQSSIAQPTGVVAVDSNIISIVNNLKKEDSLSKETVSALENRHVSKAFEDLHKRGINPLRAEIIFINELAPISPGEVEADNQDTASININYGEGANLKVNQVMRLIDLQRVIRKYILKESGDLVEDYIGIDNIKQKKIISIMHEIVKSKSKKLAEFGSDTEKMIDLIIKLSSTPDTFIGKSKYGSRRSVKVLFKSIETINNSDKSEYLRSIARYVLLNYVAQKSIAFITRINDLKSLLRESISIASTALPPPEDHAQKIVVATPFGNISKLTRDIDSVRLIQNGLGLIDVVNDDRILAAKSLLSRWGMSGNEGPDGFSKDSKHNLVSVINADVSADKTEEMFGSNKHMYANLFSSLLKTMTFMQTLSKTAEIKNTVNKSKISFTSGEKNLAKGLSILRSITPKSMASGHTVLKIPTASERLDGTKISDMLSAVSSDRDEALVELVSAVCYDQVAGANILGSGSKLLAPGKFNINDFSSLDNLLIEYFEKIFFKLGGDWDQLASSGVNSFDYSNIAKDENMLGAYFKSRFSPATDEGTKYIPNEHSYEDNVYTDDIFVNGPDYFFNKAVTSEKLNFNQLRAQANEITREIDIITHDISAIMGLDFDAEGNPDVGNINGFSDDQNPLSYFNSMCDALGKEARRTANDLEGGVELAVPLIQAGSFSSLEFTADAIKASFFASVSNATNQHMLVNANPDLDPNIKNAKWASEEAAVIFGAERSYYTEDRIWCKLFTVNMKSILKDGSSDSVKIKDDAKYPADKSKKYKSIIYNGFGNGSASFNDSKDDDDNDTFVGIDFGRAGRIDNVHDDYSYTKIHQNDTDVKLGERLNIDSGLEAWDVLLIAAVAIVGLGAISIAGVAIAASYGSTFLGAGALGIVSTTTASGVVVTGPLLTTTLIGAASAAIFSSLGVAVLAVSATAAGTAVLISNQGTMPASEGRPAGIGFSKSGTFETILLSNAALIPDSAKPKTSTELNDPSIMSKIMSLCFGNQSGQNYMIKAKPGNGTFKAWHLVDLIDKFAEFLSALNPSNWFSDDNDDQLGDALIGENESYYEPYQFDWNEKAGEYGGIFKTNTASRYALFSLFFSRIMYKSLVVRYGGKGKHMIIKHYPTCWIAMADALERKSKNSDYDTNGKYSELKSVYDHSYSSAITMISQVRNSMMYRRSAILRNLAYLKQNTVEIREAIRRAESVLAGTSSEISPGEIIALEYLRKVGFVKTGFAFLNSGTAGVLLKNYQKNYLLDFRSDEDELANPEGISVYPYFKLESYDIRELKIMAKLFSEKGRGLTSDTDDLLGRKSIFHIGIPHGMLKALQNEAYNKTGEIEYYNSNNIAIHITKKNDLDPQIKYQSRTYVFNMAKHVASFKTSESYKTVSAPGKFTLGNHLEKYDDNWSIKNIKENIEILTAGSIKPGYGIGLNGITIIEDVDLPENASTAAKKESEYDEDVYESILENLIYDHYLKLYTHSTTGIDISETLFPIDRDVLFEGTVDDAAKLNYEELAREVINRYPAANIIPEEAQKFYRVFKSIRNTLYFSSESRLKSCLATQCFQRIFSIPVSERDFVLKTSEDNMDTTVLYKPESIPVLTLTNKKMISANKLSTVTGMDEVQRKSSFNEMFNYSPAKKILEFKKGLDSNKTDVSSFVIEVAILKSSKID